MSVFLYLATVYLLFPLRMFFVNLECYTLGKNLLVQPPYPAPTVIDSEEGHSLNLFPGIT